MRPSVITSHVVYLEIRSCQRLWPHTVEEGNVGNMG